MRMSRTCSWNFFDCIAAAVRTWPLVAARELKCAGDRGFRFVRKSLPSSSSASICETLFQVSQGRPVLAQRPAEVAVLALGLHKNRQADHTPVFAGPENPDTRENETTRVLVSAMTLVAAITSY